MGIRTTCVADSPTFQANIPERYIKPVRLQKRLTLRLGCLSLAANWSTSGIRHRSSLMKSLPSGSGWPLRMSPAKKSPDEQPTDRNLNGIFKSHERAQVTRSLLATHECRRILISSSKLRPGEEIKRGITRSQRTLKTVPSLAHY
ncbi:hypothetical protein AB1N83_012724 [Pleurotus pulmonarius]